ncbi:MAG: segregation/condensation protein A [Alphaproteobacteria bacterium]|nr:segregation/condensation protein A [Alphaproteobacteria bacterium]
MQGPSPVTDGFAAAEGEALIVDVEGYEGPLDVLLALARVQKVDLRRISILALAEQYLSFIEAARIRQLDLAADYLVMASWLAYLKSRLLLPQDDKPGEPSADELAERLTLRLQRLEAIRIAAARLMARDRLGSEVFWRGSPEGIRVIKTPRHADTLIDLLKAYSTQRVKKIAHANYEIQKLRVFAIEDARRRLERMIGAVMDWSVIDALLPADFSKGRSRRSGLASTLSATLEMARDGQVELRQMAPFAPVYVRFRPAATDTGSEAKP